MSVSVLFSEIHDIIIEFPNVFLVYINMLAIACSNKVIDFLWKVMLFVKYSMFSVTTMHMVLLSTFHMYTKFVCCYGPLPLAADISILQYKCKCMNYIPRFFVKSLPKILINMLIVL